MGSLQAWIMGDFLCTQIRLKVDLSDHGAAGSGDSIAVLTQLQCIQVLYQYPKEDIRPTLESSWCSRRLNPLECTTLVYNPFLTVTPDSH